MSSSYADAVANAFKTAQAWKFSAFTLGAVSLVLAYFLVQAAATAPVILVPYGLATAGQKMTVSAGDPGKTSPAYFMEVGLADLSMILNVTPDTVKSQYERFLTRLTPGLYGKEQATLMGQAQNMRAQGLTQAFYPEKISVDSGKSTVSIEGFVVRYLGGQETSRSRLVYVLTYQDTHGYLLISDLRLQN